MPTQLPPLATGDDSTNYESSKDASPCGSKSDSRRPSLDASCAICVSPMEDPAVGGSCQHHYCFACLQQWVQRCQAAGNDPQCPKCRAPVWDLCRDPEYAALLGVPSHSSSTTDTVLKIPAGSRRVAVDAPVGITVGNNPNGLGCRVLGVAKHNGAERAGIHVGDIILAVNDLEVNNHRFAVGRIEHVARRGPVELHVTRGKPEERDTVPSGSESRWQRLRRLNTVTSQLGA